MLKQHPKTMSVKFPSIPAQILKSDITSTDASFKLRSIKWYKGSDGADVDLSASDFGAVGYGCWEPRTGRQEFFTWDTSTIANYATSGITITARGLPWGSDYSTEASTRKFSHPSGSQVLLFTDAPAMWNTMANKENDETITGKYTFPTGANYPLVGSSYSAPTDDKHIATKKYADDLAIAGAPDASTTVKGIIELATPAENAASTSTGATGARLVPATSDCTSVRSASGYANRVVVTDANGYIDQTFLDNARTWGAVQSFTANNVQITTDADSANDAVRKSYLDRQTAFGDGSDGAFAETTGTTTWNTVGKNIYQFTSFSLTGDAVLTAGANLQNKPIFVFVQGNLTITSSATPAVEMSYLGGLKGTGGKANNDNATSGADGSTIAIVSNGGVRGRYAVSDGSGGGGGGGMTSAGGSASNSGAGAIGGAAGTRIFFANSGFHSLAKDLAFIGGGGGGGGASGTGGANPAHVGGDGGNGGGCIIFFVGGDINITSAFYARGAAGSDGYRAGLNYSGGGGGGAGGFVGIYYLGSATANTATFNVNGGAGGTATAPATSGGAGGTGGYEVRKLTSKLLGI